MIEMIAFILGFFITLPVFATILAYLIAIKINKVRWRALHIAVNWTTLFYILAVGTLLHTIFDENYYGIILIVLLFMLSCIVVIQWRIKEEVIFRYSWKIFWRFCFLTFLLAYFGLSIFGLIQRIFS